MPWPVLLPLPFIPRPGLTGARRRLLLQAAAPLPLPADYLDLLHWADGGEGPLGEIYLNLWSSAAAIQLNSGYQIAQSLPHVWAIGDDSAHFYALELRPRHPVSVIRFPTGFMHPSAIDVRLPSLTVLFTRLRDHELH